MKLTYHYLMKKEMQFQVGIRERLLLILNEDISHQRLPLVMKVFTMMGGWIYKKEGSLSVSYS